jgi:enoyl-CoA hydratase
VATPDFSRYRFIDVAHSDSGVTTVTLNRPDARNAVHAEMHEEIQDIWIDIARDYDTKVVLFTGAGSTFCVGGDVKNMATMDEPFGSGRDIDPAVVTSGEARRAVWYMLDVEQPIVTAVNGHAVGLGATLALAGDITVMSSAARIGDPHVKVGLVAGDGGAMLWPLLVGPSRAKEFLLRGNLIDGTEAERIGLVNHVRPPEAVLPTARALAEELAALPPMAVRWTKLSVNRWLKDVYQHTFDVSIAFEQVTLRSEDHKEATTAFLERRPPRFTGR